jgi:hypothetical protein
MAGLVQAGHVFAWIKNKTLDTRHKAGQHERGACGLIDGRIAGVN